MTVHQLESATRGRSPHAPLHLALAYRFWFKRHEHSLVYTYVTDQYGLHIMMLSDWLMSCQLSLVATCLQSVSNGRYKHIWRSAVYLLHKIACFNSISLNFICIVKQIQPEFRYDIKIGVFFSGTKFWGDMMRSCSVVAESKYASLQRSSNQRVSQCFHLHARARPMTVPLWVDERMQQNIHWKQVWRGWGHSGWKSVGVRCWKF